MSEEKKVWPCKHIERGSIAFGGQWRDTETFSSPQQLSDKQMFCAYCGAQRPEERDELDEILMKYAIQCPTTHWREFEVLLKDLRAWKEKDSISKMAQNVLEAERIVDKEMFRKEEKPKLWELLQRTFNGNRHTTDTWNPEWKGTAKAAIEAVERVIDSLPYDGFATYEGLQKTLKQKLHSELL